MEYLKFHSEYGVKTHVRLKSGTASPEQPVTLLFIHLLDMS